MKWRWKDGFYFAGKFILKNLLLRINKFYAALFLFLNYFNLISFFFKFVYFERNRSLTERTAIRHDTKYTITDESDPS